LRESLTNVEVTRTFYYPSIILTGTAGGSSSALSNVLANPVATLGAGLTLPFLHWNEARLQTAIARKDYMIAVNDFRETLYTAFAEVDNALSARVELQKQLEASQEAFNAAVEVERLYEVQYRAGAIPLRAWLDAQETRRDAELVLAQAHLDDLDNSVALYQALGGG
jgi:outer membrane protein TolC